MGFDWGTVGRIGLVVAGYAVAGPWGGMAGAYLGSMVFPTEYETEMPPVHDYPVQSSAVGTPIQIVLGTDRAAGNIVWMGDLQSYQVASSSGGGKGGGSQQPTYQTKYRRSFLIAICEGPTNILRAWKGKTLISIADFTSYDGDGNSGISTLIGEDYAEYSNICLAYFEDYELGNSQAIPNFIFEVQSQSGVSSVLYDSYITGIDSQKSVYWLGAWKQWFTQTVTPDSGGDISTVILKLYRVSGSPGTVTVSIRATDAITGKPTGADLCSGTVNGNDITTDTDGEEVTFTLDTSYTRVSGTKYAIILKSPVTVLTYIDWKIDVSDANYAGGSTYISTDEGSTWAVDPAGGDGDFYFKTYGPGYDMNFASMIKELLTNERYGNYDESDLITADFDSIITYCDTNDLKGSLVITQQKPLPDWIAYICSHFQGYFYEIGGKIGLNCYRSQSSVLSITQDDLIRDGDEPPVHITKRAYSSTYNRLEATWTDRDNNYKTAVVPAFDRIDQRESGQVRTKLLNLRAICDDELAAKMAWRLFIDQIYRFSQYVFKLGYKSMLLEVGDVIDVTDGHLLTVKKMRVMSISEERDGRRAVITAVEDIADFYPGIAYSTQQSEAALDPDITLTDGAIAFRELYNDNKLYLSITPGGAQCSGFYIYRSYDDATFDLVGRVSIENVTGGEANSTGTIESNLPAYTAVIHRKDEAFNVSIGTVTDLDTAITDATFFNSQRLAKIGDEIIAYKTCIESSVAGIWRVSNLIRGLFATEPVAHSHSEAFSTLDVSFTYTLQESDVGRTLYFKVVSYYADDIQNISDVSSYSHAVLGKYLKPLPVSLMRINGREGLSTYKTVDVTLDWYFCSKTSGFGFGGYGNALWGAYVKDPLLERLKVELEEEDGTPITDANYDLAAYGEPPQLEILQADRDSKNPIVVKLTPMSSLLSDSRQITIEKV